jgi:rare lipoprotein A (peptidoglycan hydrolase)
MRPQFHLRARRAMVALAGLCIVIPLAALPATARSDSQGTTTTTSTTPTARATRVADVVPTQRRLNVVAGRVALVSGHVRPAIAGRRVLLQRQAGHGWRTVRRTVTGTNGRFRARFRTHAPGSAQLRVVVTGGGAPTYQELVGRLNVYRRVNVSWYGPGFYGHPLSCGGTLGPGTLGVANRTLPCGTRVTLRYHGRTLRVAVIDRGPYVYSRQYDLTAATHALLRSPSTGIILATA